jgi:starch-binding outer membrane protein, SusD/RagB family
MKNKNYKAILPVLLSMLVLLFGCQKTWLEVPAFGALSQEVLANKTGVAGVLVGAYSLLDGQGGAGGANGPWASSSSNWVYGSVAGGDAHKGSDPGDQNLITPIEQWNASPANEYLNQIWLARFDGVQRANEAIRLMRLATDMTPADTVQTAGEARFLRAHYHFELRKMFGKVPWINEDITFSAGNYLVPNNTDILSNIEEDFRYAYTVLPGTSTNKGRANKWAAAAYLARTLVWEKKWAEARSLLTTIIASGTTADGTKYALTAKYADNFNPATKNSSESVFAVQMFVNDGTGGANANAGDALNFPYGGGAQTGCCGFYQPSFSLANSFKVDPATGLPLFDTYNNTDLKNDQNISSSQAYVPDVVTPLDPRIDWTIGRRGIPFLDWGLMAGKDWIRNQAAAGPYMGIKHTFYKSQIGTYTDASAWSTGFTANNYGIIRYADVLLLAAECEVEGGGTLAQAMAYVNQVRQRASNPAGFVPGSVAKYQIGLYTSFPDAAYARKAIYFERKVELAMEGNRFFDLTRWGINAQELNPYAAHENASGYSSMVGVTFKTGHEYLPIPQDQIDKSQAGGTSVLTQNSGY